MTTCFIINRDRFTCLKNMVEWLSRFDVRVVILDNDSEYPPLLEWYDTKPCEIERLKWNWGNFVVWSKQDAIHGAYKDDFLVKYREGNEDYIVTDSDLDLSGIPDNWLDVLKEGRRRYPWSCKVGFSLSISNLDPSVRDEVMTWEGANWLEENRLDGSIYRKCAIDTTFSLVRGDGEPNDFAKCIRVDSPYTAIHLPWTYNKHNIPDDERFYVGRITNSFNHYSIRLKNTL